MPPNFPKKGLKIAHLNICSLKYKVHVVTLLLKNENLHISETRVDPSVDINEIALSGYNVFFRNDRNRYGGGVAVSRIIYLWK